MGMGYPRDLGARWGERVYVAVKTVVMLRVKVGSALGRLFF